MGAVSSTCGHWLKAAVLCVVMIAIPKLFLAASAALPLSAVLLVPLGAYLEKVCYKLLVKQIELASGVAQAEGPQIAHPQAEAPVAIPHHA